MQNKKINFIFWLMGLGCGMILSGIFMLIMMFTANPVTNNDKNEVTSSYSAPLKKEQSIKSVAIDSTKEIKKTEEIAETKSIQATEKVSEVANKANIEMIEVRIPPNAGSIEISTILKEKGIIEDAILFQQYIIEKQKTKKLRAGFWKFPKEATYEEILQILVNGN